MPYSQNNEEAVILDYFSRAGGPPGRLLDVGAFDGMALSNTRRLLELGWSGVLVDADPVVFRDLLANHPRDRFPGVECVCAAVLPESALCRFSIGGAVSTASAAHRARWVAHVDFKDIYVAAVTAATLLEAFPGPFRVISIDLEGASVPVFEQLPLTALAADLVVVEHDGHQGRVLAHCHTAGLTDVLDESAENLVVARPWA